MSTGNTGVTRWKRTRPLRPREGKHPVGRTNVTKTEDPRRIRDAAAKRVGEGGTKEAGGRQGTG